ncbi:unnamed protein product, partial [Symbiodinium pilosum]
AESIGPASDNGASQQVDETPVSDDGCGVSAEEAHPAGSEAEEEASGAPAHNLEDCADEHAADDEGPNEDLEEEEPEDDEELSPYHPSPPGTAGGGDNKDDTLQILVDISEAKGFSSSRRTRRPRAGPGPHEDAVDRAADTARPITTSISSASQRESQSSSNACASWSPIMSATQAVSRRSQEADSPRPEDVVQKDVASTVVQEAVKWLLDKLYKRFDYSKLQKVPELMIRSEGKEVFLLRSALRKYVALPGDETHDGGQNLESLEVKADLLQELLMGLADFFAVVEPPAAVDLENLGSSFLRELYKMLGQVRECRLRLLAAEPIEDEPLFDRPEERSQPSGPCEGVLGSLVKEESTGMPEVPDKDVEVFLPQREEFCNAAVRRWRQEWDVDEDAGAGSADAPGAVIEEPVPDVRSPKRPRRSRGSGDAPARMEQGGWKLEKQPIEMFE